MATKAIETTYVISPPKFATVDLILEGAAPLVVERFSKKAASCGERLCDDGCKGAEHSLAPRRGHFAPSATGDAVRPPYRRSRF